MIKLLMYILYRNVIHTDEPELFYKVYKYSLGLYTLITLRLLISSIFFGIIGFSCIILFKTSILGLILIEFSIFLLIIQVLQYLIILTTNKETPAQKRTFFINNFFKKFVTLHGKALGKKEWKTIKEYDSKLYRELLCETCNNHCYYCSLEIAKIIKDSILIWGAAEDPIEYGNNYYAHAVILRNGYIYDSNLRQSEKYEDFLKLYNFKIFMQWNYDEYSQKDFRKKQRVNFRNWCKKNNVLDYEEF